MLLCKKGLTGYAIYQYKMPYLYTIKHTYKTHENNQLGLKRALWDSIAYFFLCSASTFLPRAGLFSSVHSFATNVDVGTQLVWYFSMLSCLAILLLILRIRSFGSYRGLELFSREGFLLANILLLTSTALVVGMGTFYPLAAALYAAKDVSVYVLNK